MYDYSEKQEMADKQHDLRTTALPMTETSHGDDPFVNGELEYCDLIAELGRPNAANPFWYATDVCSKNSLLCGLWARVRHRSNFGEALAEQAVPRARRITSLLAQLYRIYLLAPWRLRRCGLCSPHFQSPVPLLFVTFFGGRSWGGGQEYSDPYWRVLQRHASDKGWRWGCVGVTMDSEHAVRRALLCQPVERLQLLPLEAFLSVTDVVRAYLDAHTGSCVLPAVIRFRGVDVTNLVHAEIRAERHSGQIFLNLLHHRAFLRMLRRLRPARLLFPWENHSWEKLLLLAKRSVHPSAVLVGHQHGSLPLHLLNFFPGAAEPAHAPFPDRLFTTGPLTGELLARYGHFPENCVRSGCAVRFTHLHGAPPRARPPVPIRRIGLALMADRDLSVAMLNLTIKALCPLVQGQQVLVRCHPIMPRLAIEEALQRPLPQGFVFADAGDASSYFDAVDCVLYSESAMGIEAVAHGIPTVSLYLGRDALGDPMFGCTALKWVVRRPAELVAALREIEAMPEEVFRASVSEARRFVSRYFAPADVTAVEAFLTA